MQAVKNAVITGATAALFIICVGSLSGVGFAAAALICGWVCGLLGYICEKKPERAFVCFAPAAVMAAADVILLGSLKSQTALVLNGFLLRYDHARSLIYIPLETKAHSALPVLLTVGAVIAALIPTGGEIFCAAAGAACLLFSVVFGATPAACALCAAASALVLLPKSISVKKELAAALICSVFAGAVGMADLPTLGELLKPENSGEVSFKAGRTLYLRQSCEPLDEQGYARYSQTFYKLQKNGFGSAEITGAAVQGSEISADDLELDTRYPLVPVGAVESHGVSNDDLVEKCRSEEKYSFRVMKDFTENSLLLAEGGVSDPMAEYEEFVMLAYSSLSKQDRERFSKVTAAPSGNIDLRLEAVKKLTDATSSPEEIVAAARYCGFGARVAEGWYFGKFPEDGKARLREGELRKWAEVFISGAGWIVFETDPRYPMPQLKLPYGDEGGTQGGKGAAGAKTWENTLRPASLPSQRSVSQDKKTDPAVPRSVWAIPAAAVLGAFYLLIRRMRLYSRDNAKAVREGHRRIVSLVRRRTDLPHSSPEELVSRTRELLGESAADSLSQSRAAFEKLVYSAAPVTSADAARVRSALKALKRAKK